MKVSYSVALQALKEGKLVAREGWNGKGMYIFLVKGECVTHAIKECYGDPTTKDVTPVNDFTMIQGVDGRLSTWVPSSTDQLAEDWVII